MPRKKKGGGLGRHTKSARNAKAKRKEVNENETLEDKEARLLANRTAEAKRWAKQGPEEREKVRENDAARKTLSRSKETEERTIDRQTKNNARTRETRKRERPWQTEDRRDEDAERHARLRKRETPLQKSRRVELQKVKQANLLANESPKTKRARLDKMKEYYEDKDTTSDNSSVDTDDTDNDRNNSSPSQTDPLIESTLSPHPQPPTVEAPDSQELSQNPLGSQPLFESQTSIHTVQSQQQPQSIFDRDSLFGSDSQTSSNRSQQPIRRPPANRTRYARSHNAARNYDPNNPPDPFTIGLMVEVCNYCDAYSFPGEKINCCHNGKVHIELPPFPPELQALFTEDTPEAINFRRHIRKYNTCFSFASIQDNRKDAPPGVYKICGQMYTNTAGLYPPGQQAPTFNQLYIYDNSADVNQQRLQNHHTDGCTTEVMEIISRVIYEMNPYAKLYKSMAEKYNEEREHARSEGREVDQVMMHLLKGSDRRRYNAPALDEIGAIFVGEHGGPTKQPDIIVYSHQNNLRHIPFISCHADPLSFVLLFPDGRPGWSPNIPHVGPNRTSVRNKVTALQHSVYHLMERPNVFNPLLHAGPLLQQKVVYDYCRVESINLNFHTKRQETLRVGTLKSLHQYVNSVDDENPYSFLNPGRPVYLPSSFNGSPRNMAEEYHNSMAVVTKCGKPDGFVTFTTNINWPEITQNLRPGETADKRPDLVARVFHLYLQEFLKDLKDRQILGKTIAHIFVIEFQKKGYPHAHILIHFAPEDKLKDPADVDSFISAQIPDPEVDPELYDLVVKFMMHGPCGDLNPSCPCMQNGQCSKKFPKDFCDETDLNIRGGYTKVCRPDNGVTVNVRGSVLDNRWVVPYCPYFLRKYRCHINVESCHSIGSVKYIYKYVYKGHDCASIEVNQTSADQRNEVKDFVDGRYISPPEAVYRLFEYKLKGRSHNIEKLPVHLPYMQPVYFEEGEHQTALDQACQKTTKLKAFFRLNEVDPSARQYLYADIPVHYAWKTVSNRQREAQVQLSEDQTDDDDDDDEEHDNPDNITNDEVVPESENESGNDSSDGEELPSSSSNISPLPTQYDNAHGAGPSGWVPPPRIERPITDDSDLDDTPVQSNPLAWWRDRFPRIDVLDILDGQDILPDSDDVFFQNVDPLFLIEDDIDSDDDDELQDDEDPGGENHLDDLDDGSGAYWAKRKRFRKVFTRMARISPRNQERYCLYLLLLHVRGPTSWTDLLTLGDMVCTSFRQACLLRNLLDDDEAYVYTLREAVICDMPYQLRQLFAYILLYCEIADPYALYVQFRDEFFDRRYAHDQIQAETNALLDIQRHLSAGKKTLQDFELDFPHLDLSSGPIVVAFNLTISTNEADTLEPTLNPEQREASDAILDAILNQDFSKPNMFFIDGPGGSGKTYTYNFLIHKLRSMLKTVSSSAITGLASTLIVDGMTTHSTFKVPVPCYENSACAINSEAEYADYLRSVQCFIIDEVSTMTVEIFHAIDRLLRDLMSNDVPFGGKIVLLGGDFRQLLPVVKRGTPAEILERCIVRSPLWVHVKIFKFTHNMRLTNNQLTFKQFLLDIGDGKRPLRTEAPFQNCIQVPSDMVTEDSVVDFVYPQNQPLTSLTNNAVLCLTNTTATDVNEKVLQSMDSDSMTYISADSVIPNPGSDIDEEQAYPVEFLNTLSGSGIPPHKLTLKVGCPIILLRHLDPKRGLTNGTRLQVMAMYRHFIDAKILTGKAINERVFISSMPLTPSDTDLPFTFRRKQLPVNIAYAMTIHKSQGQSFDRIGILLDRPCFAHGQLYVAMSRVKSKEGLKIEITPGSEQGKHNGNYYTKNIVYTNLLQQT